jgi:hypothetical protein
MFSLVFKTICSGTPLGAILLVLAAKIVLYATDQKMSSFKIFCKP